MDWLSLIKNTLAESNIHWPDLAILSLNFLLFVFAKNLLALFYHGKLTDKIFVLRVRIVQALNLFIFISYSFNLYLADQEQSVIPRLMYIIGVCYLGYLSQHIMQYFIFRRYGKKREIDGHVTHIETYNTRFLSILSALVVFILVLLSGVHILSLDSLLEAGGALGVIGVFLALTQGSWAPDIFSGLIILNSNMLEEGDVIEVDGMSGTFAMVYKTKVFHTELLNLVNNHRIMIKNSRLREFSIHNLSKFASAKGLREKLVFKISYETDEHAVRAMFEQAFAEAQQRGDINIEYQFPLEVGVSDTGDYAVEWAVYYYIKNVRDLNKTRMGFREVILQAAKASGVSLATPNLLQLESALAFKNPADSGLN